MWGNHHIFTLKQEGRSSWRPIVCNIPHGIFPSGFDSKSISISGLLFYTTILPNKMYSMFHLNLSTKTFECNIILQLPVFRLLCLKSRLFGMNGKVGVGFLQSRGSHKVQILKKGEKNIWSLILVETPINILFASETNEMESNVDHSSQTKFNMFILLLTPHMEYARGLICSVRVKLPPSSTHQLEFQEICRILNVETC